MTTIIPSKFFPRSQVFPLNFITRFSEFLTKYNSLRKNSSDFPRPTFFIHNHSSPYVIEEEKGKYEGKEDEAAEELKRCKHEILISPDSSTMRVRTSFLYYFLRDFFSHVIFSRKK